MPKLGITRRTAPVGPQSLPSFVETKPNSRHRTAELYFARDYPGIILGLHAGLSQVRRDGRDSKAGFLGLLAKDAARGVLNI